jgi:DNA repair protein RadA/Sms
MVDVVLYMEGDALGQYRILRCAKNRFGSTNEIGIFQMGHRGLEEVREPSKLFLSSRRGDVPGSVVTISMEGSRPLLAEVQALTTPTVFSQPRRTATGIDFQRLMLVTAVASKRLGIPLGDQDIIVNVVGGLRLQEPAADLATVLALVSSFRNIPCDPDIVAVAEVGLGGELRGVPQLDRRLAEAARLGFRKAVVAAAQIEDAGGVEMEIIGTDSLADVVRRLLPGAKSGIGGRRRPRSQDVPDQSMDIEPVAEPVTLEVRVASADLSPLSDLTGSTT